MSEGFYILVKIEWGMFCSSEEGGGASSDGENSNQQDCPEKRRIKKIIEQEDCFIIIVKNKMYSNNYALGGHSCIFLAFTSFRNSAANQDKIYHQIHWKFP